MKRRGGDGPHPVDLHVGRCLKQRRTLLDLSLQALGVARPKSPGPAADGTTPEDGLPHTPGRELRAEPLDWRVR